MNGNAIIIDNNISGLSTGGHYLERAITLSDVLRSNNCVTSLLTPSDRSIQFDESIRHHFDNFIFEPGFSTFHQITMNCIPVYERTILDMFKEFYPNYSLLFSDRAIDKNSKSLNRFSQDFILNFNENVESYYCAAPAETISYAISLLKIAGFHIFSNGEFCNIEKFNNIWYRVRREESAFLNIHNERILQQYCIENNCLIFSTANTLDLISGLNFLNDAERPGRLTYVLHQPKEFNSKNSYIIKTLFSRLSIKKKKLLNFTVASNEFKHFLSSAEYNFVGMEAGVTIGPFLDSNTNFKKNDKFEIYPHIQAGFHLKNNGVPLWLIKTDDAKNKVAVRFRINFEKIHNNKIFTKKLDLIFGDDGISISFVGDIRDEKLFSHYVNIILSLWNFGIKVWAIHPTFFSNGLIKDSEVALNYLFDHPNYYKYGLSYDSSLPRSIFYKILKNSSVIFNCYDRYEYACKQSGIFFETVLNGNHSLINPATSAASAWSSFMLEYCEEYFGKRLYTNIRLSDNSIKSILIPAQSKNINYLEVLFNCKEKDNIAFFSYELFNSKTMDLVDYGTISCQAGRRGLAVLSTLRDEDFILQLTPNISNIDLEWNADYSIYSNTFEKSEVIHEFYKFVIAPNCDFEDQSSKLTQFVVKQLSNVDVEALDKNPLLQNFRKNFMKQSVDCALNFI